MVYDTYNLGRSYACKCNNSDLFNKLFSKLINKDIRLKLRWMPSHLDKGIKECPENVSELDVKGNKHADTLAGEAAELAKVPLQVSTDVMFYYSLVKKIQKRIITILMLLPPRQKKQTVLSAKELKPSIDYYIENSKHIIMSNDGRYSCEVCLNSFKDSDPLLKEWVCSPCLGTNFSSSDHYRPIPLGDNFMHIGNQFIHHSHKITSFKGFVYCGQCGYRHGANQIRRLAKPCAPPGSFGLQTLKAIQHGLLPRKLDQWPHPDEDGDSSSEGLLLYEL